MIDTANTLAYRQKSDKAGPVRIPAVPRLAHGVELGFSVAVAFQALRFVEATRVTDLPASGARF
jgi:hypothetical protein